MAAVDVAVRHQLAGDGHAAVYDRVMGDAPAGGVGYGYTENSIQIFLLNVANRLQLDEPSLTFNWRILGVAASRAATLSLLIACINRETAPAPSP